MTIDPTIAFTIAVVLVPVIFCNDIGDVVSYLVQPMLVNSVLFLAFVLMVTHHSGGAPTKQLSPRDARVANWFLMNGVYFNLFLDVVSGQFQMMGQMTAQYNKVEPRYALGLHHDGGAPVFMTSMCELFFQAPLGLLAYYAYHHDKPYRRIVEFTVSVLHAAGVWWFYFPEAMRGFPYLGGWPKDVDEALSFHRLLFFWFGFWFCGLLWLFVPFRIARSAWVEIVDACAAVQRETKAE